jgi:hypothetical protein
MPRTKKEKKPEEQQYPLSRAEAKTTAQARWQNGSLLKGWELYKYFSL